jgi:hypothetical protein
MPPPGYNPEARYLRAIRQVPNSMGINAINRPQSVELEQYETEDSEEESEEADDIDHFLNDSQEEESDDDPWLKKWVNSTVSKDITYSALLQFSNSPDIKNPLP